VVIAKTCRKGGALWVKALDIIWNGKGSKSGCGTACTAMDTIPTIAILPHAPIRIDMQAWPSIMLKSLR
jgi:hypothetical protein